MSISTSYKVPPIEVYNKVVGGFAVKVLITTFELESVQQLISDGKKNQIWTHIKKYVVFNTPLDLYRWCYKTIAYKEYQEFDSIEEIIVKMKKKFDNSEFHMKLENESCSIKKSELFGEHTTRYLAPFLRQKKIVYKYGELYDRMEIVQKLLSMLNQEELTEHVNREKSMMWKCTILWNYVKFNYSNDFSSGVKLNDDVVSVINSFIPVSVRLQQLRLRYTNQFLVDGLINKKKDELRKIIIKIDKKYMKKSTHSKLKNILLTGKKSELATRIVEMLSKMEDISNGEPFQRNKHYSNNGHSLVVILPAKRQEYSKVAYDLLLLLVIIIKTPNVKRVRKQPRVSI